MKITYDEYIAAWQAPEAKSGLDNRILADNQKRYAQRMQGAGQNPNSVTQLENMTPEEFRNLRSYQMVQLLQAYKQANRSGIHNLLSITPNTTDLNEIRRVVGEKSGYAYNNGVLALDTETVYAINHIASLMENSYEYSNGKTWANELTRSNLEKVVDEMISTKSILVENAPIDYQDRIGDKIYRETNIAKRAIGKVQTPETHMHMPNGANIKLDSANIPKVGKNCFGIDDYELSWEQLVERKSNVFIESKNKLFKFLDKKINPEAERNNSERLGNKEIEMDL